MIGGMTGVSRDVIPYGLSTGNRNYLNGINVVGLRRNKVANKEIIGLTNAYLIKCMQWFTFQDVEYEVPAQNSQSNFQFVAITRAFKLKLGT